MNSKVVLKQNDLQKINQEVNRIAQRKGSKQTGTVKESNMISLTEVADGTKDYEIL